MRRCEDYDFVVKMLASGAVGANIPEVLVRYRVTRANLSRRRNWRNTRSFYIGALADIPLGLLAAERFHNSLRGAACAFVLPQSLTGKIYKKFLRK